MSATHSKPRRLAAAVLNAAIEQDWPKTTRYLDRLNAECPGEGLTVALIGWCDTFAAHANDGIDGFQEIRLAGWDVDSGAIRSDDEAPKTQRWAMDLIRARAAGDATAFYAVVQRINDIPDGWERGRYVAALIQSIALTIRSLPRGFARMGRLS